MKIKQIVEEAPKFLAEFYDITEQEAKEKIKIGWKLVKEEWEEYDGDYAEFYEVVKNYPFDLAKFNSVHRLSFITDVINASVGDEIDFIENNWPDRKLKLLEYGGGGGELSLALSDTYEVTHFDVESTTFEYAKFRAKKYGADIRFCTELPDEKFDIVSMQDVYEHIPNTNEMMHGVCDVLRPEGLFISSAYWYSTSHYLHLHQVVTPREEMDVMFANNYALWLMMLFSDEGIQGVEPKSAMGAFRYKPEWNTKLAEHSILVAPKKLIIALHDTSLVPTADDISKVNFLITVI